MHHKSTSKHGIHGMHPNCALLFTSHIQVKSKGRPCPMVIQMLPWDSVLTQASEARIGRSC